MSRWCRRRSHDSIAVGPVSVPEAVNRPQFVVRDGPNRVVVLESQRWAEPLRDGIAESVAGYLSRDLGGARVTPMTQSAANTAQLDVSLDVQRFDMIVGEAAVDRSGMDDQGAQRRVCADHRP